MANKDPLILDFRNGSVPEGVNLGEYYVTGLDDEPTDWDGIDLEETFDLPPVLPPVRLPDATVQAAVMNPVFLRQAGWTEGTDDE